MNFGDALIALKTGAKLARLNWNGPGQWIRLQVPDAGSKMGLPYLYISTVDGKLVPWQSSQTDLLADDWVELGPRDPGSSFFDRAAADPVRPSSSETTPDRATLMARCVNLVRTGIDANGGVYDGGRQGWPNLQSVIGIAAAPESELPKLEAELALLEGKFMPSWYSPHAPTVVGPRGSAAMSREDAKRWAGLCVAMSGIILALNALRDGNQLAAGEAIGVAATAMKAWADDLGAAVGS